MRDKSPPRVLHIVSAMNRGGAETLIMNIYRNMNRELLQFDFVTHSAAKEDYEDEINALGGKLYKIPSLGQLGPFAYIKELKRIMKVHPFVAVHAHTDFQSGFPALAAKWSGIPTRVCHSHSNNWPRGSSLTANAILIALRALIRYSATNFSSCSLEAAHFLFGRSMISQDKINILKNGIDISSFTNANGPFRRQLCSELELPEQVKIIGHVGHFSESKNQRFILKIVKRLVSEDDRFVALFVGDGPLKKEVEEEADRLGIRKQIRFLGVRADIPNLMKAFDIFLFPSKFEGFGIAAIEAQCSGTPCILSDAVPRSTDMGLGLAAYLSLEEELDRWCWQVKKSMLISPPDPAKISEQISKLGYSIQTSVSDWLQLYGAS